MPTTLPGLSVTKSAELLQTQDRIIRTFPEVASVYGKAGRAQTATDPAPIEMFETIINLKPKEEWRPGLTVDGLIQEMDRSLQFPGVSNAWTMPIKARIDMLSTGIRTPVGVKVIGRDLAEMEKVARAGRDCAQDRARHRQRLRRARGRRLLPGDRSRPRPAGALWPDDRGRAERGRRRRLAPSPSPPPSKAANATRWPSAIRAICAPTRNPSPRTCWWRCPAAARCRWARSPTSSSPKAPPASAPRTPSSRPTSSSTSATATSAATSPTPRRRWPSRSSCPPAPTSSGAASSNTCSAPKPACKLVVPVTLMIIFLLLYLNFRRITETLIVMLSLPFALVGGMWLMWWLGFNMSVAVAVGFIALAGVAAETGVVMLIYLDHAAEEIRARCRREGRPYTRADLYEAIMVGAVERVRPKMMTVVAIMAGLLPIMWSTGTGSEVMQRIAVPMIGGMVSSTLLTLIVIPAIYGLVKGWRLPAGAEARPA